jgi:hypothetical protein
MVKTVVVELASPLL